MMDRRSFVVGVGASATALWASEGGAQDAYPARAITLVNPFPPGGLADVIGRPLAAALEPIVKQPVVVEPKAGAAGAVGAQYVASARPDGYTLLVHITSLSGFAEVDKLFGRQAKFTRADFIPIARLVADPIVLVVNKATPSIALPQIKGGMLLPLAVSGAQRATVLPDVPTFKELGYDIEYYFWVGLFAPKGTSEGVVKILREAVNKAAHGRQFAAALTNLGQDLAYMDQPEFVAFWDVDAKRQEDAIRAIGRAQG